MYKKGKKKNVELLRNLLKLAGLVVRKEVMVVRGTSKRMDIVVYQLTTPDWYDVSVINPCCASVVRNAAAEGGTAAVARENQKISKWKEQAAEEGSNFKPFVVETSGRLGKSALHLVKLIASHLVDASTQSLTPSMRNKLFSHHINNIVQRTSKAYGNYLCIKECLMKATHPGVDVSALMATAHKYTQVRVS